MFYLALGIVLLLTYYFLKPGKLNHLTGPRCFPLVGNMLQIDPRWSRLQFHKWKERYGDVYRVRFPSFGDMLIVTGYDAMYEVLVTKGHQFSDRPDFFYKNFLVLDTGMFTMSPDVTWRRLRKTIHHHSKQFGEGLARLEGLVHTITEDMMEVFRKQNGKPFDPAETIRLTALKTMAFLIIGQRLEDSDPLLHDLNEMEKRLSRCASQTDPMGVLADIQPIVRYLPTNWASNLYKCKAIMAKNWMQIRSRHTDNTESITRLLLDQVDPDKMDQLDMDKGKRGRNGEINMVDVSITTLAMFAAGVATTPQTFLYLMYALAMYPHMQEQILQEIQAVTDDQVSLKHRNNMPFTQAVIYETLRIFPAAPLSVPHMTLEDTSIEGYGRIPKGVMVMVSIWSVHHDKKFWEDPEIFRPERFLDVTGNLKLVPPDHPTRRHLMAFSAGPRVCVGEVFALARLFLWTATLIQRFQLRLPEGSNSDWIDASAHPEDILLRPLPYKIILQQR